MQLNELAEVLDSMICPEAIETPFVQTVLPSVRVEFQAQTWDADVIWLNVLDCLSAKEVAQKLGITKASVYQAKSRVLRRLRKAMNDLPHWHKLSINLY